MIFTTTPSVEGKTIAEYLGVVTADRYTLPDAVRSMKTAAHQCNADAVIGVHIAAGSDNKVCAIGTAVKLK